MKTFKQLLPRAALLLLILTIVCGVIYTVIVTVFAQLIFPDKANGSIIEVDGKKYGSELLAQQYNDEAHMWGRIMHLDVSTFTDEHGKRLMYSAPSNLSPASEEFAALVEERISIIKSANPEMGDTAIPVELVTSSGSGLDPHISVAAANYQISRLINTTGYTETEISDIIKKCTKNKFLGVFGEKTVNVLKVNLMLDGILK